MDVESSFKTNVEFAKACKPSMRAFDDPPMASEALVALNAVASDAYGNAKLASISATPAAVVAGAGVKIVHTLARFPTQS